MALSNGQPLAAQAPSDPPSEPSMEDILASIRRIIASDQGVGAARQIATSRSAPEAIGRSRPGGRDAVAAAVELTSPDPVLHPGEIPALTDLDSLVFPPAAIEGVATAEPAEPAARHEHRAHLHDSLFPPASDPRGHEDVYDLQPEHLVEPEDREPLISSTVGASVSLSFQALTDSMLLRDPEMFERIARETLRPMLKTWLDENLPGMVERLVRVEIERVARGGRNRD